MLSLSKGQPVAIYSPRGGNLKNSEKSIYINTEDEDEDVPSIDSHKRDELLHSSFYTSIRNMNPANMNLLKLAIRKSTPEILKHSTVLQEAYERAQELLQDILKKSIEVPKSQGSIEIIPSDESSRLFVAGPSGSGKSTIIGKFLKRYKKLYPKNDIYVFSPIRDDPAFADVKPKYVKLDESILEEPLELHEFANSVCVFDDVESISVKPILEAVRHFADMCLEAGRHNNITTIIVSHILLGGNLTKKALNECNVVLFPKTNFSQISNLCRRYYGFTRDQLDYLRNLKSRWCFIRRDYPTTIVSEQAVRIL